MGVLSLEGPGQSGARRSTLIVMSTYGAIQLAGSFRTVRKNTIQIAEDIPEDKYAFAPAGGTRTIAQMLVHIAVAPQLWQDLSAPEVTTLEGYDFATAFAAAAAEEQKPRTKAEIVNLLQTTGETFGTFLEGLSDAYLAMEIGQGGGRPAKTRLEGLLSAKEHEMHHRAQLMLAERLLGIVPHLTRMREEQFAAMHAKA